MNSPSFFYGIKKKGFTLVELLVVLSISTLLSSIVFASVNGARAKARDAKRTADLKQLQTALELYYDKQGGYTPDTVANWEQPCVTASGDLNVLVTGGFISKIPCDPLNTGSGGLGFGYYYDPEINCTVTSCDEYCLRANLEQGGQYMVGGGRTWGGCRP